ncbi:threonylcarbamoyl-AMP synthase [candidate division Kazan bacterium RIFCSPHIGHO2_01_FULL_49_10]|uniref:L-threonylcarbamoyladenylate synthase n=1 Tax=candidate division Kazan bacterium RIFCSPLOWO2_01_FULL_48_13 TaxID=1798539 RepID=A0A1F4PPQ8_UNCK3|nr:MAG: threonylcarbamoyl-AMP synthase [candidate division Kazan bacterium RIFCSPHIGHO2_01_FULL_49_10]OGB85609.1 MAG: threonylcarbamoyl-AMP synthase [candidate division Kazan bacterium RIFCSPLOWO2_01_FULL_48_13]
MEIVKINPNQPEPNVIAQARATLLRGGIIAYPTDTVYGLGAIVSHPAAVRRIKEIKGRAKHKPLSIMVKDLAMADYYGELKPGAERYLPGRFTVLINKKATVPSWITPNNFVGIRIPEYAFTRLLMAGLLEAVVTTSANISWQTPVHSISNLLAQVGQRADMIDLIIDAGELAFNPPSTLVNMSE